MVDTVIGWPAYPVLVDRWSTAGHLLMVEYVAAWACWIALTRGGKDAFKRISSLFLFHFINWSPTLLPQLLFLCPFSSLGSEELLHHSITSCMDDASVARLRLSLLHVPFILCSREEGDGGEREREREGARKVEKWERDGWERQKDDRERGRMREVEREIGQRTVDKREGWARDGERWEECGESGKGRERDWVTEVEREGGMEGKRDWWREKGKRGRERVEGREVGKGMWRDGER